MKTYDLLIIGGGPAGVAAGVYASRKKLQTLLVTEDFGGQSIVSEGIENWIGTVKISGADLAKSLENHLKAYAGDIVEIMTGSRVISIKKHSDYTEQNPLFVSTIGSTIGGENIEAISKSILIATGSAHRKLPAKGADTFEHKGLTYCATCDGPLFSDTDVAVVGGGNAALEAVAQLSAYCKSVTLINRSKTFRADPITVEKVLARPNVSVLTPAEVLEVKGEKFVNGLTYKNIETGEEKELSVNGIFVEIGMLPATGFAKDIVELNEYNKVIVNPITQRTKTTGIWASGDCTDGLYHQNNIAVGDAVKALEDIYISLSKR
ncbi:MAG: FAD-dependent oxidoreductase [bacterium]